MYELADALQEELDNHCTEEDFILKILQRVNNVCIFGDYTRYRVFWKSCRIREKWRDSSCKADSLMKNGEYADGDSCLPDDH